MSTLVIGGDHIKAYRDYLVANGLGPVWHWSGRKNSVCHRVIPVGTRLVVILVDQVSHCLADKMRRSADTLDLPVVYSRRSISQLGCAVDRLRAAMT